MITFIRYAQSQKIERQIIWKSLGARRPKDLNWIVLCSLQTANLIYKHHFVNQQYTSLIIHVHIRYFHKSSKWNGRIGNLRINITIYLHTNVALIEQTTASYSYIIYQKQENERFFNIKIRHKFK